MSIELKAVGDCLDIDNRTLRYVVEAEMVPGIGKVNQGRGSRRTLTHKQAVQVAVAAALHQQGFRGDVLKDLVKKSGKKWQQDHEIKLPHGVVPLTINLNLKSLAASLGALS